MAVVFKSEQFEGGTFTHGKNPSWSLKREAEGSSDQLVVRDAAVAQLPSSYDGMPLQEIQIEAYGSDSSWLVSLLYAPEGYTAGSYTAPPETGQSLFTFDTGGGTKHITQSINMPFRIATGIVPDYKGAIGVTKSGVAGLDITSPQYQFKETHYIADATVTEAYKKGLATLTGQVNNAAFRGFEADEVLFLGASGSYRENEDDWEISFNFAQSDNRMDLVVGAMVGIEKKGWEYLEAHYQEKVDAGGEIMVVEATDVVVHQVYERGAFAGMGI